MKIFTFPRWMSRFVLGFAKTLVPHKTTKADYFFKNQKSEGL